MTNELFRKGDFERIYKNIASDSTLLELLTTCYENVDTSEMTAGDKARETIFEVARYNNIKNMLLREESKDVLDEFLSCLGDKIQDEKARKQYLHQLNFGFGLYQSEDAVRKLHDGKTIQSLFDDYIVNPENAGLTEEEIRASLENRISAYHISSENMEELIKMLEKSDVVHYTSALTGENAERFKCIIAAYIYKNAEGKISIPEAVTLACTAVETEDIADAVGRGLIAKDKARKILGVIFAAACVALIAYIIYSGGTAAVIHGIVSLTKRLVLALVEMQWLGAAELVRVAGLFSIEALHYFPVVTSLVSAVIGVTLVKKAYDKITDFIGLTVAKLTYLDDEECIEESYIAKGFKEIKNSAKEAVSAIEHRRAAATKDANSFNCIEVEAVEVAEA